MLKPSAQSEKSPAHKPSWPLYSAFVGSMVCHLIAVVVCALVVVMANASSPAVEIDANWETLEPAKFEEAPTLPKAAEHDITISHAKPASNVAISARRDLTASQDVQPASRLPLLESPAENSELLAGLAENVGPVGSGKADGSGAGGNGGTDSGAGFFGFKPEGKSIVFVVDASASMNRPHDSEWKTRFRRLKGELLKSVGNMTPEQQFFIIFFNDETHLMPSRSMQTATATAKQQFLKWAATRRATGSTDPRQALGFAVRLQPDSIYFLTDGSFDGVIKRDLMKLRQSRTEIHTFAFSDRTGEGVLKNIAKSNGGKYHYVP